MKRVGMGVAGAVLMVAAVGTGQVQAESANEPKVATLETVLADVQLPTIEQPAWLKKQIAAEKAAAQQSRANSGEEIIVLYTVSTRGEVSSDLAEFRALANETLNDSRGWARMNVTFKPVASGGQFTLVLSEASQVPSFSGACSVVYSCRVGQYIIINEDRWNSATPSWNNAGGNLRDYRHMVINHEVGHWLGHGHTSCGGANQAAPIMLQQSIDLQGCNFNPWPLASELYSGTLGR